MDKADKVLYNLSKYKLYDKLNEKVVKDSYCQYCRNKKNLDKKYKGFHELCSRFARNLTRLSKILEDEHDNKERCRYFIFWIHDQIKKKLNVDWKDEPNANSVLVKFYQVEQAIQANKENNNCSYEFMTNTGLDLWIEAKYLYDYIKNYDDVEKKITDDNKLCPIYKEYLRYIEKVFENFRNECCTNSSIKCPKPLKSNEWCAHGYTLRKFSCDISKELDTDSDVYSTIPVAGKEQLGDESHSAVSSSLENQHDTNGDGMSNNTDYYSKLGVSLPFIGIISSFVYLYNFTTFGTWIRSKLLRKNKMNLNLDDDAQHLLQCDSENIDLNTYNDDFNINYHSS
ncbi:PIR Superfamily Protein [Plasmodium ovale curtisi]|uniref:PIR Superfamily Protein n=1 Tax=Plasmodium ovale curtisi TaxID=864141 RepID=A0A1A8WLF7_PLAOA|nr:PIR Superfamily Protein [Plasmodium ovale curtisi]